MRRTTTTAALLAAACALTSACDDSTVSAPRNTAPSAAIPTVPPSGPEFRRTTNTRPVAGSEAGKQTEKGAAQAVRWYYEHLNYSTQHPDTAPPDITDSGCAPCESSKKSVEALRSSGRRYDRDYLSLGKPAAESIEWHQSSAVVRVRLARISYAIVDGAGTTVGGETIDNPNGEKLKVAVTWRDNAWHITGISPE